jgi:hypothetical protein
MLVAPVSLRQAITQSGDVEWNRNATNRHRYRGERENQSAGTEKSEGEKKVGHYRKGDSLLRAE